MKLFKDILKQIKKYDTIVVARHIGADPDALGSQFAMKELITLNFPNKKVYAIGSLAARFKFMGSTDKIDNVNINEALLIVLDTPDIKRIDGVDDITQYAEVVKIDHHPFIDRMGKYEYVEEASSTSQLIFKFILDNKLRMSKKIAENIYVGIIGDTDRFLHDYTTIETYELVTKLLELTKIDFTKLYPLVYSRPLSEVRLQGYIYQNFILTENQVAYIKVTDKIIKEFDVDSAAAGNMINDLKFVEGIKIWTFFSEDVKTGIIKANIRSHGIAINETAMKYGGGGHIYAAGARLKSWDEADNLIKDLDEVAKNSK